MCSEGKEQDATIENAAGLLQKDAAKEAVPTGAWSLGRAVKLKGKKAGEAGLAGGGARLAVGRPGWRWGGRAGGGGRAGSGRGAGLGQITRQAVHPPGRTAATKQARTSLVV